MIADALTKYFFNLKKNKIYDGIEKKMGKTVQTLYKAMFGVHRNGPCYKWTLF